MMSNIELLVQIKYYFNIAAICAMSTFNSSFTICVEKYIDTLLLYFCTLCLNPPPFWL